MTATAKVTSFVKLFLAVVKGDTDEAKAQKSLQQADNAIQAQVYALKGDTMGFEDALEKAKEAEQQAVVNSGNPITDRGYYVSNLLSAKNNVTSAEESLAKHKSKISYLQDKLAEINETVEA